MLLKSVLALFLLISLVVVVNTQALLGNHTTADRQADLQLNDLGVFALATDQYVRGNPGFIGILSWSGGMDQTALRTSPGTPEATRDYSMNPDWKAVVSGPGDYVICARLKPETTARIAQRMPAGQRGMALGKGPDFVVFDKPEQAPERADQCA